MAASSLILKITPTAERDLAEIWTYIAADDPRAATRFVQQVEDKFEPLCEFPGAGSPRDHLAAGLRAVPYKSYVIYYVHTDTDVTIVRVVHGARDLNAMQFDAPSSDPESDR